MKKLIIISAIAVSGLFYNAADAQVRFHLGVHVELPRVYVPERVVAPEAAPVVYNEPANYGGDEDYYYLPDVGAYYSVPQQCYYYNDGENWVSAAFLPGGYRDYDWRSARHYEVRAPRPFMHDDFYRNRFNGVAFNGQWNRRNDGGYANYNRADHNQYGSDERRDGDFHENYRQQNRGEQHFAQNTSRGRNGYDRGDNRHGRY